MFNFATLIQNPIFGLIFKVGILLLFGLFLLFLLVMLKQIRSMNTIITQPDLFPIIQSALVILIGFALFLFVLGVVIL